MIEEFSEKLRKRRKELGFDLEEVVERTKLHPSVIKALENGEWDSINATYLKGFLKIYASSLGVDAGEILEYLSSQETSRITKPVVSPSRKRKKESPLWEKVFRKVTPEVVKKITYILASVIAIFLVVTFISFLVRQISHLFNSSSSKVERVSNLSDKVSLSKEEESSHKDTTAMIKKQKSVVSSQRPKRSKEEIEVSLRVKKDCFVRVKRDGKVVFEGVLPEGAIESWDAKEELEFKISDGSSVDVEVGGKFLPPLSKIHRPIKSLKVTPKGISITK